MRLIDTSHSIGRSGGHGGRPGRHHQFAEVEAEDQKVVGCITPRMKLWNTNQNRHIHGLEALNFQGINYSIFGPDSNAQLLQYSSA